MNTIIKLMRSIMIVALIATPVFAAEKKPKKRGTFELPPGIEVKPLKEQIQDEINRVATLLKTVHDQNQKLERLIQHMQHELNQSTTQRDRCKKIADFLRPAREYRRIVQSRVDTLETTKKHLEDLLKDRETPQEIVDAKQHELDETIKEKKELDEISNAYDALNEAVQKRKLNEVIEKRQQLDEVIQKRQSTLQDKINRIQIELDKMVEAAPHFVQEKQRELIDAIQAKREITEIINQLNENVDKLKKGEVGAWKAIDRTTNKLDAIIKQRKDELEKKIKTKQRELNEITGSKPERLKAAKTTIGDYQFIVQGEQRSPSEPGFRGFGTPTQFIKQIERFYGDAMTEKIYKEKTPAFKK